MPELRRKLALTTLERRFLASFAIDEIRARESVGLNLGHHSPRYLSFLQCTRHLTCVVKDSSSISKWLSRTSRTVKDGKFSNPRVFSVCIEFPRSNRVVKRVYRWSNRLSICIPSRSSDCRFSGVAPFGVLKNRAIWALPSFISASVAPLDFQALIRSTTVISLSTTRRLQSNWRVIGISASRFTSFTLFASCNFFFEGVPPINDARFCFAAMQGFPFNTKISKPCSWLNIFPRSFIESEILLFAKSRHCKDFNFSRPKVETVVNSLPARFRIFKFTHAPSLTVSFLRLNRHECSSATTLSNWRFSRSFTYS